MADDARQLLIDAAQVLRNVPCRCGADSFGPKRQQIVCGRCRWLERYRDFLAREAKKELSSG